MSDNDPIDVKAAAKYMGVEDETVRRWCRQRKFPYRRAGRSYRFILTDLDAWMRQCGEPNRPAAEALKRSELAQPPEPARERTRGRKSKREVTGGERLAAYAPFVGPR